MSDVIDTKKIIVIRECVIGKKCDICGKEIPPTNVPHLYGEPIHDYYKITTHHYDWGNDSIDSYEHFDACSPDCAYKLWEKYIRNSAGTRNTMCIEIEHNNCWTLSHKEVTEDA